MLNNQLSTSKFWLWFGWVLVNALGGAGINIDSNARDVEIFHNTFFNNVQAFNLNGLSGGGKKASNLTIRNNIIANSTYRNGFIRDTDNVILSNNLFTVGKSELYQIQGTLTNLLFSSNITLNLTNLVFGTAILKLILIEL